MCWRGLGRLSSVTDCAFSERSCALGPLHGDGVGGSSSFLGDGAEAAPRGPSRLSFCARLSAGLPSCVYALSCTPSTELLEGGAEEGRAPPTAGAVGVGRGGLAATAGLGGRGPMGRSGRAGFG